MFNWFNKLDADSFLFSCPWNDFRQLYEIMKDWTAKKKRRLNIDMFRICRKSPLWKDQWTFCVFLTWDCGFDWRMIPFPEIYTFNFATLVTRLNSFCLFQFQHSPTMFSRSRHACIVTRHKFYIWLGMLFYFAI